MRRLSIVFGIAALAACGPSSTGTSPPAGAGRPAISITQKPKDAMRCESPPAPETTAHAATGTIPAWRAPLGEGTGALSVDVADGLVIARLQGGKSVSVDFETGAACGTLIGAPGGVRPEGGIDPYTAQSAVVNGTLVGPSKLHVSALDIRTGAALWSRQLVGVVGDFADEYALRDGMTAVAAGSLTVIDYHVRHQKGVDYRFEEIVIGVDPRTGAERWRKSVLLHAWGEPMRMGGDARLSSDGQRAMIETPDRLLVVNGATGAEAWSLPWPRGAANHAFAGADRVLIAKPGAPLELRDAKDGKLLGSAPAPGRAITGAVVRRDGFTVAAEDTPGNAFLESFSAAGRSLWKRAVAYSVVRLRGLDGEQPSSLYVLEGNGRLSALDERTGAAQGSLTVGFPMDFTVARARSGVARVLLPLDGIAAFEIAPGGLPKPLDPFLRWYFEPKIAPDDPKNTRCHPSAVAWVDGAEKAVWRRELPPRLRSSAWGACDDAELLEYMRRPRHTQSLLYAIIGVITTDNTIAVADGTGLLALRLADGAVLLDRAARLDNQAYFFFDSGEFQLSTDPPCAGPSRRGRVFAPCGSSLLYFNGTTALLVDASSWRVTAEATYTHAALISGGRKTEAAFQLGGRTLSLRGVTHMH